MNADERKDATVKPPGITFQVDQTDLPGLVLGKDNSVDLMQVMKSIDKRPFFESMVWRERRSSKSEQKIAILDTLLQFEKKPPSPLLDCPSYSHASSMILSYVDERIVDRPMPSSIIKNLRRLHESHHIHVNFDREHENAPPGMRISAIGAAYLHTQASPGFGYVDEIIVERLFYTGSLMVQTLRGVNIGNYQTDWKIKEDRLDAALAGTGRYETAWVNQKKESDDPLPAVVLTEAIIKKDVETAWSFLSTSSRESIIEEILVEDLSLKPAILGTVMESYLRDIGPRSKAPAFHRVVARLVGHIEDTRPVPEEYVNQYILRCAALQLRSTMDWHIGLREAVQVRHHLENANPFIDDYQVCFFFIEDAIKAFENRRRLRKTEASIGDGIFTQEDLDEITMDLYGEDSKTVFANLDTQIGLSMTNFTQSAIDAGLLPPGSDPREAFIQANELGFSDGPHIEVDFLSEGPD